MLQKLQNHMNRAMGQSFLMAFFLLKSSAMRKIPTNSPTPPPKLEKNSMRATPQVAQPVMKEGFRESQPRRKCPIS